MGYTEITMICDGAHESTASFDGFDTAILDAYLKIEKAIAKRVKRETGIETEIYVLEHEHDESEEDCSCAQYLTDHHPIWSTSND